MKTESPSQWCDRKEKEALAAFDWEAASIYGQLKQMWSKRENEESDSHELAKA
ncbi:hypothetical protein [Salinivibrio sp. VYel6]|uniref:hypothetical protein n=1 Tax=Salinivibrio sp. VYel6 TaxID=2490493 RepID=UPI001561E491|nr:hypothetical protein [Salinivibrio sp. VYel6]